MQADNNIFSDFNLCVGPEPRLEWSDIDQQTMLLEQIIKYCCKKVYSVRDTFTTLHSPNKLERLSMARLSRLVYCNTQTYWAYL
jgi:hypothetical protein